MDHVSNRPSAGAPAPLVRSRRAPLSRRTLLRGAGAALCLPWLDAMQAPALAACSSLGRRGLTPAAPALRFVGVYIPNGVLPTAWTPTAEGRAFDWTPTLDPLAEHGDAVAVLSGLTHDKARANGDGPGDHARAAAAFLTGVQPLKTDGQVQLGMSMDQRLAQHIGGDTRFRSLALGLEPGRLSGQCDSGYACAYSSHISWKSATQAVAKEAHPRLLFERLFGPPEDPIDQRTAAERKQRKQSVLDFVRSDAKRLRRRLGTADAAKLDEYLEALREVERRLERAESDRDQAEPEIDRPVGTPGDYREHADLMGRLLTLALAGDQTRVATWMLADEGSNRAYREIGLNEGHHSLSHYGEDVEKQELIGRINRMHIELFANFLGQLHEQRESGSRLLERTVVLLGSGIGDGSRHWHHELPVLLCGGSHSRLGLKGRQHVRYPEETPFNNLLLSLLGRFGVDEPHFGDSTGRLDLPS